ncbi:MAG: phosphatidate cytidylyltransferase [Candidatus Omnitrophota bacterium]
MITQLTKRLMISFILIVVSAVAIFHGSKWVFALYALIFILVGLDEFFTIVEKKGFEVNKKMGLLCGAAVPISIAAGFESLILVLVVLALFIYNFRPSRLSKALTSTALTVFGIIYVAWFLAHVIKIHNLEHGARWVFYVAFIVKSGDAGAYFVGKKIGRTKLIEHISPNKSVEGAWGGFLTTVVLSIFSWVYLPHVFIGHLLLLGILLGILSQVGDLGESLFKRDAGVKDSGHLPGVGGLLDVLDSLILTIPFLYYYLSVVMKGVT